MRAVCSGLGDDVLINGTKWDAMSPRERIELMAHEITHSAQYDKLGYVGFLNRYRKETGRSDNYIVPPELANTPIEEVDLTDPRYTLDQIAERVATRWASTSRINEPAPGRAVAAVARAARV